jgi:hypothetical protein
MVDSVIGHVLLPADFTALQFLQDALPAIGWN